MDSIRIERLRCLTDTGYIQIKPITVLIGQNSSGKSTFLRFFPLLKQSIESRTTGPILWYGRLVDFGNFNVAHQTGAENTISFSFKFELKQTTRRNIDKLKMASLNSLISFNYLQDLNLLNNFDVYLTLEISEDKEKETTWASKVIIKFEDSKIELEFNKNRRVSGFKVNSLNILEFNNIYVSNMLSNKSLLPNLNEIRQNNDSDSEIILSLSRICSPIPVSNITRIRPFIKLFSVLIEKTKLKLHHSTSSEKLLRSVLFFGLGNSEIMLNNIKQINSGQIWQKKTNNWTTETKEFQELRDLIIANLVPFLLDRCDDALSNFSKQISYMGPLRATAERYYRSQDLAVDEVDYQGRNLTMFLRNLTFNERQEFASWTWLHFGFQVSIQSSLDHISLKIRTKNSDKELNIADTGFGFSQILPIITQLWFLSSSKQRKSNLAINQTYKRTITYAIEQPELHLHPRLQGNLTDALVAAIKAAKDNNIDLRLIIETHSEVLINRLGHLIDNNQISSDDINIVVFEPSYQSGEITIRNSYFDSEGYLMNWPLGFFDMESV